MELRRWVGYSRCCRISAIYANYVTMIGNGCNEEYPIVDAFPAQSCYDSTTGGFGDSWSGQDTNLSAFTCNHCVMMYNTKDGFIGPHTHVTTLLIENSVSIGNMGQQWKWGNTTNSTTTFINNLTVGNCNRMSAQLPGAPHTYNLVSGLPGAFLGEFCRASGDVFSFSSDANSTVLLANNTVVAYSNTVFDLNCNTADNCATTPFTFTNNILLGYSVPENWFPGGNGSAPGLFYLSDPTDAVVSTYNDEYGVRNGDCPTGGTGILCVDPALVNEPAQGSVPPESTLDVFNPFTAGKSVFYPTSGESGCRGRHADRQCNCGLQWDCATKFPVSWSNSTVSLLASLS